MKNKIKIMFIFAFIILGVCVFESKSFAAVEIDIGETKSFALGDLAVNGITPSKITSASSNSECISVEEKKTGFLFWNAISEIAIKGVSEGTAVLTIFSEYTEMVYNPTTMITENKTTTVFKEFEIKVIDREKQKEEQKEELEEEAEEKWEVTESLKNEYKRDIADVKEDSGDKKLDYLASIIYNDEINGNTNLWDKFVSETTAEERKAWWNFIGRFRTETYGWNQAKKALYNQVQVDEGNITEEEFDESYNNFGNQVNQIYQNTITEYQGILAQITALVGENRSTVNFTDVLTDIGNYIPSSEDTPTEFVSKVNVILTVITSIGMVVSILILAVIGIKYMLGSVEERADYKKDMIPYIVGAVLLFGVIAIVKMVQQIGESINNI